MAKKKAVIITRAYNRLEYTIQTINSIRDSTIYPNYEHWVINNNSSDGTKEWLLWAQKNLKHWIPNLKFVNLDKNLGDWGGLIYGVKNCADDAEYVLQFDNDITVPKGWLTDLINVLDGTQAKIVQLKRLGVGKAMVPKQITKEKIAGKDYEFGPIKRPVAVFIMRKDNFLQVLPKINKEDGGPGKTGLGQQLKPVMKLLNVKCQVIGGKTKTSYENYEKYPKTNKSNYERN